MPINDFISEFLVKTGLKKTEEQLCEESIRLCEEHIRDLNDQLTELLEEAERMEQRLRAGKAHYDAASPTLKPLHAEQLRSLMKDFGHIRERQALTLRNLEKEKLLLQGRRIELDRFRHPTDTETVAEAAERKEEVMDALQEEDEEIADLEQVVYQRKETEPPAVPETSLDDEARLNRELAALLGDTPSPEKEAEEKPSEKPVEIA